MVEKLITIHLFDDYISLSTFPDDSCNLFQCHLYSFLAIFIRCSCFLVLPLCYFLIISDHYQ